MFCLFILLSFLSSAQILENKVTDISSVGLPFHVSFIKENKIKIIKAEVSSKPDDKTIEDKGLIQCFEFDSLGKLNRYYYTRIQKEERLENYIPAVYRKKKKIRSAYTKIEYKHTYDTLFTCFYYDSLQRLVIKRADNGFFFDTFYYQYDSLNNIKKEIHCKETSIGESRVNFRLGIQTVLSMESFEYEWLTATQLKKKCLNDEGRVYKQAIINYDEKGSKNSEDYEYLISWLHIGNKYNYDSSGNLVERIYVSDAGGYMKERSIYEYDLHKNLLVEKIYKNDLLNNEINFLYDSDAKFLKSQLNRDFLKKNIGIVKYSYEFY